MKEKYYITQDQLESLILYRRGIEMSAERIANLCSSEKADMVYGFELGKIHSQIRDSFCGILDLEYAIGQQTK